MTFDCDTANHMTMAQLYILDLTASGKYMVFHEGLPSYAWVGDFFSEKSITNRPSIL